MQHDTIIDCPRSGGDLCYKIEVNKDITKKNTQSVGHTKSRNASNDDEIFNKVVDLFDGEILR